MTTDPLIDMLKQLSPEIPTETKASLLYQCGAAASEAKFRKQRLSQMRIAALAVMIAIGIGAFVGHKIPRASDESLATHDSLATNDLLATIPPTQSTNNDLTVSTTNQFDLPPDNSTLAAAMPYEKMQAIFRQQLPFDNTVETGYPSSDLPFTTRTRIDELESL